LGSNSDCVSAVSNAENQARTVLSGKLGTLFADIRRDAPGAHVVVLGYPEFYDLARSSGCIGLSTTKRNALDGGADVLDGVIKSETGNFGGFTYADVISAFAGHEICDSSSWLHSVDWTFLTDSYHPTAAGQASGYEPVLARAAG
ncbi:MAG: lipase, partial [Actinobacteria bacterium]|nr:lipase [Actinomycetota bacterium]